MEVFKNALAKGILLELAELSTHPDEKITKWYHNLTKLDFIETLILDPQVNEIILHQHTYLQYEKNGYLHDYPLDSISQEDFLLMLEILAIKEKQAFNYSTPFQSFYCQLKDINFRATLVHHSLTPGMTSKLFLRRIGAQVVSLESYARNTEELQLLQSFITEKKNVIIAGSTGSGKTTLLSRLLTVINSQEHLVILEDTHELIHAQGNITHLLSEQNKAGKNLTDYCKYALRMRPDRIVIGELRGEEAIPFILSMNNGHKGLLSSIHAHSAQEALTRLAMLFSLYSNLGTISYETILKLICQNIDYVIHMKDKKINEIVKVYGSEGPISFVEKII